MIPAAYLPGIFGKISLFSIDLLGQLLSEIIVFRNQRAGDKAADPHVCCIFAASVLWAKAAGNFGKSRTEGT